MKTVYISIGSNLGDRLENCRQAIGALSGSRHIRIQDESPFYHTQPVDVTDQAWFLNAVIKVRTDLAPPALLDALQGIQKKMGQKEKEVRFGPRIIDLDILLYEEEVVNTPELVIPHPRMHKRCFVLKPLCDIDPDMIHPVIRDSMRDLLFNINDKDQRVYRYECD